MNRISDVTMPKIEGKSFQDAMTIIYDHCYNTSVQVMQLTNEVVALKQKVQEIERNQR